MVLIVPPNSQAKDGTKRGARLGDGAATPTSAAPTLLKPPIGIAIAVTAWEQPGWVLDAIRRIIDSDCARPVLLVRAPPMSPRREPGGGLAWALYRRLDRRRYPNRRYTHEPEDVRPLLANTVIIDLGAGDFEIGRTILPAERSCLPIAEAGVYFGAEPPVAELFGFSAQGFLAPRLGSESSDASFPPGAAEVMEQAPVTEAVLLWHPAAGSVPRVVYQSWSRTHPVSAARNYENLASKAAQFPLRVLEHLHATGKIADRAAPATAKPATSPRTLAVRHLRRMARRAWDRANYRDQWVLGYGFAPQETGLALPRDCHLLRPPADRGWADPFPLRHDGEDYIFFEEIPCSTGKGHITCAHLGSNGQLDEPRVVIERPYHLSYPFLFRWQGELFMIPESGYNSNVQLLRCVDFPGRWVLEKILLEGLWAVDATLMEHAGCWWMFVNVGTAGAENCDELHVYHAACPLDEWLPHPLNPVLSDVRCARPAGNLFRTEVGLFRPAQNCAPRYGRSVVLRRIVRLTPDDYWEETAAHFGPEWHPGLQGFHTLNRAGDLLMVDGILPRRRFL